MERKHLRCVKRFINSQHHMETIDDSDDDSECVPFVGAGDGNVVIRRDVLRAFEKLPEQTQGRFKRIMEMWCNGHNLSKEMMNTSEGRSKIKNRMIKAFKAFKIRLYGFSSNHCFTIVEIDDAKKQNKSDPRIIDRAKKRADLI